MILLELPGGSNIPYLTTVERTAWEAANPVDGQLVIDSDENKLYYWDNGAGVSVEIPIGGGTGETTYVLNVDVTAGATGYTNTGLIGATVSQVARQGQLYRVVSTAPANSLEIQFNSGTGALTMFSGDEVEDGEWWQISYYGVPEIVSP